MLFVEPNEIAQYLPITISQCHKLTISQKPVETVGLKGTTNPEAQTGPTSMSYTLTEATSTTSNTSI